MRFATRHALAVLVVLVAVGVGSSAAGAQPADGWPTNVEHSFLVNCYRTSHGKRAACECSLGWLERRYTVRQMVSLSLRDRTRFVQVLARAVVSCTH
jgi:hypothetical protein